MAEGRTKNRRIKAGHKGIHSSNATVDRGKKRPHVTECHRSKQTFWVKTYT